MEESADKLFKILKDLDGLFEFEVREKNILLFNFKNQDYLINLATMSAWSQRLHMPRAQIRSTLIDKLIKYHRYYIFGLFGYDDTTDTFSNWTSNYLQGSFATKSLYTHREFLEKAVNHGISQHLNKDDNSLSSIHFQSKYLGKYLQQYKSKKLILKGDEIEFQSFDHYHTEKGFQKISKSIDRHHTLTYSGGDVSKISNKWDREEYIITLDLYFKLQKNNYTKNAFKEKDPLVKEVYEFLKLRSKHNKTVVRTLDSLSYRHANYQFIDPKIKGGLDGGAKKSETEFQRIFKEFVNKQGVLKKEALKIKEKFDQEFFQKDLINVREYQDQDPNKKLTISIKGLDEEDIKNKQEKANRIHIKTVNILANYLRLLGLSPFEEPKTFDLFAYDKNEGHLFEVKSITKNNFRTQIRHAIIQLEEYEFKHKSAATPGFQNIINKTIVFDKNPYELLNKESVDFYFKFAQDKSIKIMCVIDNLIRAITKFK